MSNAETEVKASLSGDPRRARELIAEIRADIQSFRTELKTRRENFDDNPAD